VIVEDPNRLSPEGHLKGELFRLFRHVWFRANPLVGSRTSPTGAPRARRRALETPSLAQSLGAAVHRRTQGNEPPATAGAT
jgi:hypothetical protein